MRLDRPCRVLRTVAHRQVCEPVGMAGDHRGPREVRAGVHDEADPRRVRRHPAVTQPGGRLGVRVVGGDGQVVGRGELPDLEPEAVELHVVHLDELDVVARGLVRAADPGEHRDVEHAGEPLALPAVVEHDSRCPEPGGEQVGPALHHLVGPAATHRVADDRGAAGIQRVVPCDVGPGVEHLRLRGVGVVAVRVARERGHHDRS